MRSSKLKLGIIGLGKIGGDLALQATEKGIFVVGKAKHPKPELAKKGVNIADSYQQFHDLLDRPRAIYLSLPAGQTVDDVIGEFLPFLEKGDVIMDGGNSFYKDSIRREEEVSSRGIYFLDCGTSGGIPGARHGACFMVGGKPEGFKIAEPILRALAVEGGVLYTGNPGSGHFVKLVHNGIEFGMLQAIGEGTQLLIKSGFGLDLAGIFENWSHGSVIRGWLVELMEQGLRERNLNEVPSFVEDTGEVNWLLMDAIEKEIPIPVISQSVMELFRSRDKQSDDHRAVALMRHGFGGHPFGPDANIASERKTSRVQKI